MVIIKEEKPQNTNLPLEEMAQFKGAGIIVEVRSKYHGKLGSPGDPAHAHVFDSSGRHELAEIILTKNPPRKASDVFYYRTENIPDGLSKAIVKFATAPNLKAKHAGIILTNWQAVITQWAFFHED
jgi:hypothetical protein